jgi:hypothetical protein
MNNLMPCITDSDEWRFEPDGLEDESPMTEVEKRIQWIRDDWVDALENDNYDEWRDVRMAIHGAYQTLIHCKDRHDDSKALTELSEIAFKNGLDCIQRGRYEGATA